MCIREEVKSKCSQKDEEKEIYVCPTFTCHAFLAFISFLWKNRDNNVTPGSWCSRTQPTANHRKQRSALILSICPSPIILFKSPTTAPCIFFTHLLTSLFLLYNKEPLTCQNHSPNTVQISLEIIKNLLMMPFHRKYYKYHKSTSCFPTKAGN